MPVPTEKKKKGVRDKPVGAYAEQWEEMWTTWPEWKSVPGGGKDMECKKEFKSNEALCRQKYTKAIVEGKITAEMLNYAAKVYVAVGIRESLRKGRNELQYLNGMLPWLNQSKYLQWANVEMPESIDKIDECVNYGG